MDPYKCVTLTSYKWNQIHRSIWFQLYTELQEEHKRLRTTGPNYSMSPYSTWIVNYYLIYFTENARSSKRGPVDGVSTPWGPKRRIHISQSCRGVSWKRDCPQTRVSQRPWRSDQAIHGNTDFCPIFLLYQWKTFSRPMSPEVMRGEPISVQSDVCNKPKYYTNKMFPPVY